MISQVSIIIVNYNGLTDTCELIDSLVEHETFPYEVIVVDNASTDSTQYFSLQQMYPHVKVLRSDVNLGFAGGNNLGIKQASGDYILLLNNDVVITAPFLEPLVKRLMSDLSIGAVSPKIANWPDSSLIQSAGSTPMSPITMRNNTCVGLGEDTHTTHLTAMPIAYAHGAAMMIRTSDLLRFGTLPECYFLYYEELDWCHTMRMKGFSMWYEPNSIVYHKGSATTGKESPLKVYYMMRNRLVLTRRTVRQPYRLCSFFYFLLGVYPKTVLQFVLQRKLHLIRPLTQGLINGFVAVTLDINYGLVYNKKRS